MIAGDHHQRALPRPMMSRSLELARGLLGQRVTVRIDRPMGSRHPRHGFLYQVSYGYVPGVIAPDGEELDAYLRSSRRLSDKQR
jgi:inorganic pyrophosphatase